MHSIAWWPTLIAVTVATVIDLRTQRIPNWLVLPFLLAGIVVSLLPHGIGIQRSLLGLLLAVGVLGIFWWLGGMGMGDVKLYAAIGAWIGPEQLVTALVVTGIAGGVMAISWALAGGFLKDSLIGAGRLIFGFGKRGMRKHPELVLENPQTRKMPYAPAIAIGTMLSFFAARV
jgi:prepilin peptidase CpaA